MGSSSCVSTSSSGHDCAELRQRREKKLGVRFKLFRRAELPVAASLLPTCPVEGLRDSISCCGKLWSARNARRPCVCVCFTHTSSLGRSSVSSTHDPAVLLQACYLRTSFPRAIPTSSARHASFAFRVRWHDLLRAASRKLAASRTLCYTRFCAESLSPQQARPG